ncbi:MAG: hypothetical protein IIA67_09670 [Planctomycetes bacterium]|nr:hypothetical protein [Planctomycetota bacterium]
MPTLIVIEDASGLEVGRTTTESKPQRHEFKIKGDDRQYVHHYHEQQVTWTTDIKIPTGAKPGDYIIRGIIGFQTCFKEACDQPQAASFTARLPVGEASKENLPLSFTKAKFGDAKTLAEARPQGTEIDFGKIREANKLSERSFVMAIALAFLAGLILNIMPCVLPVIGLKVMSFVQQAGESRSRVLALNLWYSAGLMSVFMALATLAVVANLGWGDQFSSTWFGVTMTAIVFVFGLSLLGVWEVPIPGFVGSGKTAALAEREGASGAFSKGVLTTILATPCIGPFLGPSLTWAMQQPVHITYAVFFSVGLGMASPYILIGAFPKLVAFLPKPGAWMETFKQAMGFVLMATVVFLLTVIPPSYIIPTIGLLIGLSITCWWVGRTPMTADRSKRLTAWVGGAAIAAAIGVVSFGYLHDYTSEQLDDLFQFRAQNQGSTTAVSDADEDHLPWRPFSEPLLTELVAEGKTVLIDFTGPG